MSNAMQPGGGTVEPSAFDSLGRGTMWMLFGTVALLLLNFIGRVLVARNVSTAAFGDFNLGISLVGLLTTAALLGLHQATARSLAEHRDAAVRRRLIRWSITITSLMAFAVGSLVFLLAPQIASLFDPAQSAELTLVFELFAVTVSLTLICTQLAAIFQGFEDTVPNAWINQAVQPAAFVVFLVVFIEFHLALEGALLAWVISNGITFVALVVYTVRRLPGHLPPGPVAKELPPNLLTLSLALWGVSAFTLVLSYADTLILGGFRPETQVGVYSAVMMLARLMLIVGAAVTYIFLPVAARLTGHGQLSVVREMYTTTSRWMMVFMVPIFFVFAILPVSSTTFVFGAGYATATPALIVVTVGALLSVLFGPVNAALAGIGATRPLLLATGIAAVTNVALSFSLIPSYGLLGAAVAWTVARVLDPAIAGAALWKSFDTHPFRRSFVVPLGTALGVGTPLFVVFSVLRLPDWSVVPLYLLGLALCILMVIATRSIEPGDLVVCRIAEAALGRPLPRLRRVLEHSLPRVGPEGAHPER